MKCLVTLFAGLFIAGFWPDSAIAQTNSAQTNINPKVAEAWGWSLARDEKVAGIEISSNEISFFLKGFLAGIKNEPLQYHTTIFADVEQLAKTRREKVTRAIVQKNLTQANTFLESLRQNTNILALPENVFLELLKDGAGATPKPTQSVTIRYIARLLDGTEFYQAGPLEMVLVTNRSVCRGWISALEKLKKGASAKLYVPPPLSEDEAERWGIEPGAMMVFDVELLDVQNTSPENLANAMIPPPPNSPPDKSGYNTEQIIEAWGWNTARRERLNQFNLSNGETSSLAKGLAAAIRGEKTPEDLENIFPRMEELVAARREWVRLESRRERALEMEKLFTDLKQNTNVVELPDGLRYEILKPGGSTFPKPGQTVLVNYIGHLIDGSVFDKTIGEPLHLKVGTVIPGWDEGIQKVSKGGKIKLYIPPSLGYGEESVSGIPAGSTLIFEIELVDIVAE